MTSSNDTWIINWYRNTFPSSGIKSRLSFMLPICSNFFLKYRNICHYCKKVFVPLTTNMHYNLTLNFPPISTLSFGAKQRFNPHTNCCTVRTVRTKNMKSIWALRRVIQNLTSKLWQIGGQNISHLQIALRQQRILSFSLLWMSNEITIIWFGQNIFRH